MQADSEENKCFDQRNQTVSLRKGKEQWTVKLLRPKPVGNLDLFRTLQRVPWKLEVMEQANY